jgi:type IV secretory pathway VirB10-like protein
MKRFYQNEIPANGGEASIRTRPAQRHYTVAGAAILVIIILHFVSQFIFVQSEKTSQKIEAISHQSVEVMPENAEVETESAARQPEAEPVPDVDVPEVQPETKTVQTRVVIKKKETRESRTERLRRAEKLLTGV